MIVGGEDMAAAQLGIDRWVGGWVKCRWVSKCKCVCLAMGEVGGVMMGGNGGGPAATTGT